MMGSSQLLAASRQSFAFARDGALPLSNLLYRFNKYTGTPVNTVWFDSLMALLVGLLALSGPAAVNAVFSISVTAQYVAFMTPIIARFAFENNFKPGPFSLGVLVSGFVLYTGRRAPNASMLCFRVPQLQQLPSFS
jgi:amino acid transporter